MRNYFFIPLIIIIAIIFQSCKEEVVTPESVQSPSASSFNSDNAVSWMKLMYEIVSQEDIPAPECSRLYGYVGIATFESVFRGIEGARSLGGQLKQMPQMPSPGNEKYDWLSVMAATLKTVSSGILYEPIQHSLDLINDLYSNQIEVRKETVEEAVVNRSVLFGEQIGNAIIEWSNSDNFLSTRDLPYTPPPRSEDPSYWEPTLPGQYALEPFLRFQRPFCLQTADMCAVPLGIPFDTIPGTPFYEEGMEVLLKRQSLTTDEMNIAFFWEDKSGTGQPPGHWVSITNIIVEQFSLKLDEAAKVYALVGAAIRDAFISCWESKYRVNLLRPKTYIRDYLGEPNWNPLVNTPPFPEYTSGHSVVSGAVAEVLTSYFGDNVSFVDDTHDNQPGYRNRSFNSFYEAADEAAWSRLYGGIHFRSGIINGVEQGRLVGQEVLNTIQFN
jgi:hypothetical protein